MTVPFDMHRADQQDLRERYAEDSDTCKKAPEWDPPVEVGGLNKY